MSASQDEVYNKTVRDIVPTILNGYHATIFAYGATGAGKTHTMMGSERDGLGDIQMGDDHEDVQVDGIIPHALTDIFRLIHQRQHQEAIDHMQHGTAFQWQVLVSYLEVYNEQIRDLLRPSARPLALREDPSRGIVHVAGLHHEEAHSVSEVLELLRRGNRHRKTEPTAANQVSSRSHAVIQVIVRHTTTTMLSESNPRKSIIEGKLSLIDLAGSERASNTQNRGVRLTEGANINKSLLALANCINSLATTSRKVVRRNSFDSSAGDLEFRSAPRTSKVQYRDSKLTHLLKNSLEGDCRLVMIANVNPSHAMFEESHNTLKYANRAKNIRIRPKLHVMTAEMTYQQRIEKLEQENHQLRRALAEHSATSKRKTMSSGDTDGSPWKRSRSESGAAKEQALAQALALKESQYQEMQELLRQMHEQKAALTARVAALERDNHALRRHQTSSSRRALTCSASGEVSRIPRPGSLFSSTTQLPKRATEQPPPQQQQWPDENLFVVQSFVPGKVCSMDPPTSNSSVDTDTSNVDMEDPSADEDTTTHNTNRAAAAKPFPVLGGPQGGRFATGLRAPSVRRRFADITNRCETK
ncbi:TPA: hypothetical protein N0F65_002582 [Lagenidium giganteum]|uniref:Kinesin-like protein n=1 Tax=Lagenidium giganteum TaxID=4803 RepID=A0AAV2YUZ2_9STRA|nr:TPA: hypothetical protein N0F65_002582 [Lagenidium giganteum]